MDQILVVAGPTASGKTEYARILAEKHNGELVNYDSVQMYKYLDIGSNKGKLGRHSELSLPPAKAGELQPFDKLRVTINLICHPEFIEG